MKRVITCSLLFAWAGLFFCPPVKAQQWWDSHFITGMMFDPPIMVNADSAAYNFQRAIYAGFNLFTGDFLQHDNCNQFDIYGQMCSRFQNDSTFFFVPRWSTTILLQNYNGKFCFDEPDASQKQIVMNMANSYILNHPSKLCYVNLFPSYKFSSWQLFSQYLDIYCNHDSIPLPVLSFDNYYPHTCFLPYDDKCTGKKYFSNLAEMRKRAGDLPLWSWILTSDWMTERDTTWQKAFLRLSAFAPIAYGAKGILCYSYDAKDKQKVVRALDYRNNSSWDSSFFFRLPEAYIDDHQVFFGNFTTKTSGDHPDIGVKTDEANGKWHLKYSTPTSLDNNAWDFTNHGYGTNNGTIPLIVQGQDKDMIAAIANDGRFLVAINNTTWQPYPQATIPDFNTITYNNLSPKRIAAISYNPSKMGKTVIDLCMAWNDSLRVYFSLNPFSTRSETSVQDTTFLSNIKQVFTSRNNNSLRIHAISIGTNNIGWKLHSLNNQTKQWSSRTLTSNYLQYADHFWMEEYGNSTLLCMQLRHDVPDIGGRIYYGRIYSSSNNINMTEYWPTHSVYFYKAQGIRNTDGGYDLYCAMVPEYHKDAIIDRYQHETVRLQYMSDINLYIRKNLAPIVMNCMWKGCYHATTLPDTCDKHIMLVDSLTTPVIKSMNSSLMAGIFEAEDSLCYLVIVNKSNQTLDSASITLRGNGYAVESMVPRINTNSTSFSTSFNPLTMSKTVIWEQMTGGECVVLRLRKARNYFNTHCNSFMDQDNRADINYRFNNGNWKIDYAANGFGSFDSAYSQYGSDSDTYPILADYNGDGITDLALFRYQPYTELLIDSSAVYGAWNIRNTLGCSTAIPYIGLFDNDNKADFAYVNESNARLYIRYANQNFSIVGDSINQYGTTSNSMPAVGDYDGDGMDDLALYLFWINSSLFIDYNGIGGLHGWNQITAINYITGSDRYLIKLAISDYDGDGKADFSYYDPRDNTWNIDFAYNNFGSNDYSINMGISTTGNSFRPVATDYDGDGMADMSLYVYNSSSLNVYIRYARDGFNGQVLYSY